MTVFSFTFRDAVRKKAFIVSTVILLALVLIACALPRCIELFSTPAEADPPEAAAPSEAQSICYLLDGTGLMDGLDAALNAAIPGTRFEPVLAEQADALRQEIAGDGSRSLLQIVLKDGAPYLYITTKDFMTGVSAAEVAEAVSRYYVNRQLTAQGISEETIAFAQSTLPYEADIAGQMDLSGYALGLILTVLMFFAIYYYGYGVSMSVATEKASRVMETLVVSAKPSRILIGKCLAMGAAGLAQFAGVLIFAYACYRLLVPADFTLMGLPLSFASLTLPSALLIVLYFLLGYSLYAVMNAVCGASVSKIEDLNSAMLPVMLIAMISFYLGYINAVMPNSGSVLQKAAMYIPFSSPFIIPFRLLNGDVLASDLIISIALLIVAIIVITLVCIRIYSASVLQYGKRMKLKELYRTRL